MFHHKCKWNFLLPTFNIQGHKIELWTRAYLPKFYSPNVFDSNLPKFSPAKQYLDFSGRLPISPLPVSETIPCHFIALELEGLHHQTAFCSSLNSDIIRAWDPRISTKSQLELGLLGIKRELAGQPAKPRHSGNSKKWFNWIPPLTLNHGV